MRFRSLLYLICVAATASALVASEVAGRAPRPLAAETAGASSGPGQGDSQLTVLRAYELSRRASPLVDIRWASKESVFILGNTDGTLEHALEEGLPARRLVLPGRAQLEPVGRKLWLGAGDDFIAAVGGGLSVMWRDLREHGPGYDAQLIALSHRNISDADLNGSELAILGIPPHADWEEHPGAYVWKADLRHFDEGFETIAETRLEPRRPELARRGSYMLANAGSLRFTPKGGLVVYPAFDPVVRRFSSSGKLEREWNLVELRLLETSDRLPVDKTGNFPTEKMVGWLEAGNRVDDLFVVGESTPALILRSFREDTPVWTLVMLDGDEARRFTIPGKGHGAGVRVRGDARKDGTMVFLFGERGRRIQEREPGGAASILVARLPEP